MSLETMSTKNMAIMFGLIAVGAAIFIALAVFPASNLIRETVTAEGVIAHSSEGVCVVDTPDGIPKTIKGCELPVGTTITVSFKQGMYEAELAQTP